MEKMMKKWFVVLVSILAISIVLGCVGNQPAAPTPSPTQNATPTEKAATPKVTSTEETAGVTSQGAEMTVFSWQDVPGNDSGRLIDFIKKTYGIDWVTNATIEKIGDTINISTQQNHVILTLNPEQTNVTIEIDGITTDELKVKKENGGLICYSIALNSSRSNVYRMIYPPDLMNSEQADSILANLGKPADGATLKKWLASNFTSHGVQPAGTQTILLGQLRNMGTLVNRTAMIGDTCQTSPSGRTLCYEAMPTDTTTLEPLIDSGSTIVILVLEDQTTEAAAIHKAISDEISYLEQAGKPDICGIKFEDKNGNGMQDPGESGLAGWTIQVQDANGNVIAYTVTNSDGKYCIDEPAGGTYTVVEVPQNGWVQTSSAGNYTVEVGQNQTVTGIDFGNKKIEEGGCNLEIRKSVSPNPVVSGQQATVNITVTNVGNSSCEGVTNMTDNLPAGLQVLSIAQGGSLWNCGVTGTNPPATVACTWNASIQPVPPGSLPQININVNVTAPPGSSFTNCATVTNDANPSNNQSCVTVNVNISPTSTTTPTPTLSVTATPTIVTVGIATSVTFTVTSSGAAVSGATVTLSGSATGTGTTDGSGKAVISVNAASAGTITAAASKTGYTSGTANLTANAPTPTPTPTRTPIPTPTRGIPVQ